MSIFPITPESLPLVGMIALFATLPMIALMALTWMFSVGGSERQKEQKNKEEIQSFNAGEPTVADMEKQNRNEDAQRRRNRGSMIGGGGGGGGGGKGKGKDSPMLMAKGGQNIISLPIETSAIKDKAA